MCEIRFIRSKLNCLGCLLLVALVVLFMNGKKLQGQNQNKDQNENQNQYQDTRIEVKGYTLIKMDKVKDKGFSVYYWIHNQTGAKVVYIKNSDPNRFFSIGFKTIPSDSTGVFHILEHSVLEGSKKYPIRGLFEELKQSNITTYMNAYTYQDKTIYPVASNNLASFINLSDVYLDSVFNPLVKEIPYIFYQEGVRREFQDGKLTYNGIVFNEMSATLTPERVMWENMIRKIYKDSFLDTVSGGDPLYIPDLSYQTLIETYNRYYHPSNSLMFFYGDIDISERLESIDENYLSKYQRETPVSTPKLNPIDQGEDIDTNYYPAGSQESQESDSYLSMHYIFNTPTYLERLAVQTVFLALFDDEASSVREDLFGLKLFSSMESYCYRMNNTYMASLEFSGMNSINAWDLVQHVNKVLERISQEGIDPTLIRSVLIDKKFKAKTIPSGNLGKKLYMEGIYNGWIYDEDPLININDSDYIEELLAYSDEDLADYMVQVIKKYILGADIKYNMLSIPDSQYQKRVEKQLQDKTQLEQEGLTKEAIDKLKQIAKETSEYSSRKNTESDIKKLPSITLEDLKSVADPKEQPLPTIVSGKKGSFLTYDTSYDEILHVSMFFDISSFSEEEILYLSLISTLFGRVSTNSMDLKDLNIKLNLYGNLKIRPTSIHTKDHKDLFTLNVDMDFLQENGKNMLSLGREILYLSRFDELDKILQIIEEYIEDYEEEGLDSPLDLALSLSNSFYSQNANFMSLVSSSKYVSFIKDLKDKIKNDSDFSLTKTLENIRDKLIKNSKVSVGIASKSDLIPVLIDDFEDVFDSVSSETTPFGFATYKLDNPINIGLIGQQNTSFLVLSTLVDIGESSSLKHYQQAVLLHTYLSNSYLYQKIRVQGGAYGANMFITPDGLMSFYTISDPNPTHTLEVIEKMPEYMDELQLGPDDDFKTKIVAVSEIFSPRTPYQSAKLSYLRHLKGVTEEEVRKKIDVIINTDLATKLKECVSLFASSNSNASVVIVSNEDNLEGLKQKGVVDKIQSVSE